MKSGVILAAVGGLVLATVLVLVFGAGQVWHSAATLGWAGLGLVTLIHLSLIGMMGLAWWMLGRGRADAPAWRFIWGRLIRDSASEVLPLSQLGGFVLGARAATVAGVAGAFAAGSTVVDVTLELIGQLFYTLLGLVLLAWLQPGSALVAPVATGIVVMVGLTVGCFVLQARGAGLIERAGRRLAHRFLGRETADSSPVQAEIQAMHARSGALALATSMHFACWVLAGTETWLTLRLMEAPISLVAALAIDSMLYGLRSVAFMVPNALGVQEGGLILLGAMFGVSAEAALALSLIKRARDLLIGVPALLTWQALEWRRSLSRERSLTEV